MSVSSTTENTVVDKNKAKPLLINLTHAHKCILFCFVDYLTTLSVPHIMYVASNIIIWITNRNLGRKFKDEVMY